MDQALSTDTDKHFTLKSAHKFYRMHVDTKWTYMASKLACSLDSCSAESLPYYQNIIDMAYVAPLDDIVHAALTDLRSTRYSK